MISILSNLVSVIFKLFQKGSLMNKAKLTVLLIIDILLFIGYCVTLIILIPRLKNMELIMSYVLGQETIVSTAHAAFITLVTNYFYEDCPKAQD